MKNKLMFTGILSIVLVFGFVLAGCDTGTNEVSKGTPTGKNPGKFSATVLSDTMGSNSTARSVSLGEYTVSNSKSIYFILRNVGDFPITNISLTAGKLITNSAVFEPFTDNGITVSPHALPVLETSGNVSVETVIEVDINHGNVIGLTGQQYVHKADFAGTTLRIQGKTTNDAGEDFDISLDLDIEMLIKVCSFEVHYSIDGGQTYVKADYEKPPYEWATENHYIVPNNGKNFVKIKNTGNVPLRYKFWENGDYFDIWESRNEWVVLNVGAFSPTFQQPSFAQIYQNYFLIDTQGVAFDNGGIEELVFRSNSSIVISSTLVIRPAVAFFILEP